MEEDRELRFVCKFCYKRYPCGKSLGAHMRSHVIENSAESDEQFDPIVGKVSSSLKNSGGNWKDSGFEIGGQSGYGLRENPKKTWRAGVGDSKFPSQKEQICKQCGKGFQSLKALCGHMACHSEKERGLRDDQNSWTSEKNQKVVFDCHSDTEAEEAAGPRRQRPRRAASMRYKRIFVRSSSSVSENIDHEQEEVAMCLMMLSRDSGNWVGFNSVAESSDNNSVVLETKSSSIDMKIRRKKLGLNCVRNGDEGKGKLKSCVQYENSDSGYFMNGPKKVDSDVSVDGFLGNESFKKQKVGNGSGFKEGKCRGTELRNGLANEKGYDESGNCSNLTKYDSRKRKYESGSKKKQDLSCKGERRSKSKKSKGHECPICHKVYKSGQALGGHKRSHFLVSSDEKNNRTPVTKQEISETTDLLDLNLPAPVEEEANEHDDQFMPW